VYVGSSDGLVTCWRWGLEDVDDGEPRLAGVLAGHGTGVLCLAVSGRVVVSGSADGTLCVWRRDDDDDDERAGHTGPVKCVAVAADDDDGYDADGERRFVVYSGSLDGSVKVWRLSEERALEPPPAVEATPAPLMAALRESQAWMPRPRTAQLPSPVQAWAPELKGVAAA
jgi:WD40 repeat protein